MNKNYQALEDFFHSGISEAPPIENGSVLFEALVKMAMEGVPDTEGAAEEAAEAGPQNEAMAVPLLQQLISSLFAQQMSAVVAGSALGEHGMGGMGGDWECREHARKLLGKLAYMTGGGFSIPIPPKVSPPTSKWGWRKECLARKQQHLILAQKLEEVLEGDPFCYELKQMISSMSNSVQNLSLKIQAHERGEAEEEAAEGIPKVAAEPATVQQESPQDTGEAQPKGPATQAATVPNSAAQPVFIPPPEQDSPAAYVAREQQLMLEQQGKMLAYAQQQANQLASSLQQAQAEGQQQTQAAQQAQGQAEQTQAQLEQTSQQAQAFQQQAVEAEGRAAQHASEKMQLGMRVQQMRQNLAQLATQDPVSEQGANLNDLAAQGQAATPDQLQQQQAEAEQQQAVADGTAPAPTGKEAKEQDQAQRAQEEAQVQSAQAQNGAAAGGATANGPAAQVVKTSSAIQVYEGSAQAYAAALKASRLQKEAAVRGMLKSAAGGKRGGYTRYPFLREGAWKDDRDAIFEDIR